MLLDASWIISGGIAASFLLAGIFYAHDRISKMEKEMLDLRHRLVETVAETHRRQMEILKQIEILHNKSDNKNSDNKCPGMSLLRDNQVILV